MQLVAWCILSAIRKAMVTNSNTRVKVPTSLAGTQPTVETFSNRDNEETSLNPLGRVDSDSQNRGSKQSQLVSCKRLTTVATMNVRTIRLQHKQEELASIEQH